MGLLVFLCYMVSGIFLGYTIMLFLLFFCFRSFCFRSECFIKISPRQAHLTLLSLMALRPRRGLPPATRNNMTLDEVRALAVAIFLSGYFGVCIISLSRISLRTCIRGVCRS